MSRARPIGHLVAPLLRRLRSLYGIPLTLNQRFGQRGKLTLSLRKTIDKLRPLRRRPYLLARIFIRVAFSADHGK